MKKQIIIFKNLIKMKKTYSLVLFTIIAISSIAFISCNDEEEQKNNQNQVINTTKVAPGEYELGLFVHGTDKKPDTMFCNYSKPGNCFHEVVIVAPRLVKLIENLMETIPTNGYVNYVRTNKTELEECFNSNDLDEVINGNLSLSYNKTTDKTFIIFTNIKTKATTRVYPFVLNK